MMDADDIGKTQAGDIAAPLRAAHRVLEELSVELRNELDLVMKSDKKDDAGAIRVDSQAERRILIRSIFSYIEAITYSVKALILSDPDSARLSRGEKMFAAELAYELRTNGDVASRPAKIPLTSNLKFTFKIFSKVFENWTELDTSGLGWECLLRSVKVRDRITHPKTSSDLLVSDEQVIEANHALRWFDHSLNKAMMEWGAVSTAKLARLTEEKAELETEIAGLKAKAREREAKRQTE
jgi:hypothetical protein